MKSSGNSISTKLFYPVGDVDHAGGACSASGPDVPASPAPTPGPTGYLTVTVTDTPTGSPTERPVTKSPTNDASTAMSGHPSASPP